MKTQTKVVTTAKSLSDISMMIRQVASKLRVEIDKPELSPFGYIGFQSADISIALSGSNFILGGPRKWGVQIMVKDKGSLREIEMVAVGDDFIGKLSNRSFGRPFFQLGDSVDRMNTIARMF